MTDRKPPRTEELLAAYAAPVADEPGGGLTDAERARVAALIDQSPDARRELAAIGALVADLRAIAPAPPPASEAVVRAVRLACLAPVPWPARVQGWLRRRWRVAATLAVATGAAVAIAVMLAGPAPVTSTAPITAERSEPPDEGAVITLPDEELWLDGEATDLAGLDDDATADLERALGDALAAFGGDADDDVGLDGLLPEDDLDWIDELDDETTDELERWLAELPS